ncbi:hypothetical protein I79_000678 [Cricetulus griseus]|uniref:Uncharacterized protein n=1 Tax=Cricetulus griseus TaxID=10029 RepID=G3GSR0_CRIGR|nr:hypothetical protein I79_000678 [Cricetulus griseus]
MHLHLSSRRTAFPKDNTLFSLHYLLSKGISCIASDALFEGTNTRLFVFDIAPRDHSEWCVMIPLR